MAACCSTISALPVNLAGCGLSEQFLGQTKLWSGKTSRSRPASNFPWSILFAFFGPLPRRPAKDFSIPVCSKSGRCSTHQTSSKEGLLSYGQSVNCTHTHTQSQRNNKSSCNMLQFVSWFWVSGIRENKLNNVWQSEISAKSVAKKWHRMVRA